MFNLSALSGLFGLGNGAGVLGGQWPRVQAPNNIPGIWQGGQSAETIQQISRVGSFGIDALGQYQAGKSATRAASLNREILERTRDDEVERLRRRTRYEQSQNQVMAAAAGTSRTSSMVYAMADNAWQRELDVQDRIRGYNDKIRGSEREAQQIRRQTRFNVAGSLLGLIGEAGSQTGAFYNPFEKVRKPDIFKPDVFAPDLIQPDEAIDPFPAAKRLFEIQYDDPVKDVRDSWNRFHEDRKIK